jgi:eukaryotic translation initiation factor 2C
MIIVHPEACAKLGFGPTITLVIVSRGHKTLFFPASGADADSSGNCPAGTVIDSGVISPTYVNYYLYGHAGQVGTSKPAHYTVLVDENNFTYVDPSGSQLDADESATQT